MSAFSQQEEPLTPDVRPSLEEIVAVSFGNWFSEDRLASISFKSRVIVLPEDFLIYLEEDGIVLPSITTEEKEDGVEERGEGAGGASGQRSFPELDQQIQRAIEELGGEVFIKLNWSSPMDASWMIGGSLKCFRPEDVYLLLKASDRITFDIEYMMTSCAKAVPTSEATVDVTAGGLAQKKRPEQVTLVVRKWANLHPSMEFRLFVHGHKLVGMCQRDVTSYYDFLHEESEGLAELLQETFETKIAHVVPSICNYVVDVYVDRKKRVWIIDLNVFGQPTSSLLFDWHELLAFSEQANKGGGVGDNEITEEVAVAVAAATTIATESNSIDFECEFRIIESARHVLPSELSASRGPIDVTFAEDFSRFKEVVKQQANESDSNSDA